MSYNHNRWSISKQSNKTFRKHQYIHFGGNRRDPLNLNELIQKKKQLTTNNIQMNIHDNDRLVEILLPPNIFDPLRLDISSNNNNNTQKNFQPTIYNWFYDQQVPEQK